MIQELPTGYTCRCGTFHPYHAWVYAHWDIPMTHTCRVCGNIYDIVRGEAFHRWYGLDEDQEAEAQEG